MKYSELRLPIAEFDILVMGKTLSEEEQKWLGAWRKVDLAMSPTPDERRGWVRLGHYIGWFDKGDAHESK